MTLPPPPPSTPSTADTAMVCYRHPDREAGRRCTRCGKPACGECLVQAAVGSHCLECAKASRPDARTRARHWNARQPAIVTMALIAVNVLVFVYITLRAPIALAGREITIGHAQLGLTRTALGDGFAVRLSDGSIYFSEGGEWWRLITSGFLHFGIIHLGFNMYLLYMLGQMLEPSIGRIRFALVYFAALLGGAAGSVLLDEGLAGGASGAVFGLMGLAVVGYWLHGANPLNTSIGSLLMLNLFVTFFFPGISIGGHLGGATVGALCGFAVMAPRWKGVPRWASFAVPIALAVLSVAIAVALV
jgi:membrane associated rhomboid family serine protease